MGHLCAGLSEDLVLAMKPVFNEDEMRSLLIMKLEDGVSYHNRQCFLTSVDHQQEDSTRRARRRNSKKIQRISEVCSTWFNQLSSSDAPDLTEDYEVREDETDPVDYISEEEEHSQPLDEDKNTDLKKEFACNFCPKVFQKSGSRNKHQTRIHRKEIAAARDEDQDTCDFTCHVCSLKFHKRPSLMKHIQRKHKQDNKYSSEGCERIVRASTKSTKENVQNVKDSIGNSQEPAECSLCGNKFPSQKKMFWHLRQFHQLEHKPCPLCGLMVKKLSDHIKRQHVEKDVKKFACEICGLRFKGQSGLEFHKAGHTGERNYECRKCSKPYRTSTQAYNCERGHKDIFKWRCQQCSFRSHQRNKYVRHLRTHSKSQPYRCPLCDHKAARKDYLQKHLIKFHAGVEGMASLEDFETSFPDLYSIEENISLQPLFSYKKEDLLDEPREMSEETLEVEQPPGHYLETEANNLEPMDPRLESDSQEVFPSTNVQANTLSQEFDKNPKALEKPVSFQRYSVITVASSNPIHIDQSGQPQMPNSQSDVSSLNFLQLEDRSEFELHQSDHQVGAGSFQGSGTNERLQGPHLPFMPDAGQGHPYPEDKLPELKDGDIF